MANVYIGINIGGGIEDVTHDSSTTSSDVEVVVNLASGLSKAEIMIALEMIEAYLSGKDYPLS